MRYLACITFDGTDFYGTQVQINKKTVSNTINDSLSKILNISAICLVALFIKFLVLTPNSCKELGLPKKSLLVLL